MKSEKSLDTLPAGIYLLKVNNRNTRTKCEICSKLTIKTPERRLWPIPCSSVSIVNFEKVNAGWLIARNAVPWRCFIEKLLRKNFKNLDKQTPSIKSSCGKVADIKTDPWLLLQLLEFKNKNTRAIPWSCFNCSYVLGALFVC